MIELYLVQKARIIIHTPGIFLSKRESALMYLDESLKVLHEYKINVEAFHMLDDNGEACNDSYNFSRDDCIMDKLYNVRLEISLFLFKNQLFQGNHGSGWMHNSLWQQ